MMTKLILWLAFVLWFSDCALAQYQLDMDSAWLRKEGIKSIRFTEEERILTYSFDGRGLLTGYVFTDTLGVPLETVQVEEFKKTELRWDLAHDASYETYSYTKELDVFHRPETETHVVHMRPDGTGPAYIDSFGYLYCYDTNTRMKYYFHYTRDIQAPEMTLTNESDELTYLTSTGLDSISILTYPYMPLDTVSLQQFYYQRGQLAEWKHFTTYQWIGKGPFTWSPTEYRYYTYRKGGQLKMHIDTTFSDRRDPTVYNVSTCRYNRAGYYKRLDWYHDGEHDRVRYSKREIYAQTFKSRIQAARRTKGAVEVVYYE